MPLNGTPRRLYRFGPFILDATERILLRDRTELPLSPKVLDTLLILVENEGHILEKGELMRSVLPNSFVEESSLTQKIFLIRKVLGEKDGGQPYIETIPRRGYRFVADVVIETVNPHSSATIVNAETSIDDGGAVDRSGRVDENRPPAALQTAAKPRYRSRLIPALVTVSCILAVCAAAGIYQYGIRPGMNAHANVGRSSMEIARLTTTGVARV